MPALVGTIARIEDGDLKIPIVGPLTSQSGSIRGTLFTESGSPVFSLLSVDGTTPKTLTAGPTNGATWYDVELRVLHEGAGNFGAQKFGGCSAPLSTGLEVKVAGTALVANLYANEDAATWGRHEKNVDFAIWTIPLTAVLTSGQTITIGVAEDLTALTGGTNARPVLVYRVHA